MRKVGFDSTSDVPATEGWLDLEQIAQVEVTSEDPHYPVESAFRAGASSGWRAGGGGEQAIRLVFDSPQRVHRIVSP
jgi:hypothetical protein